MTEQPAVEQNPFPRSQIPITQAIEQYLETMRNANSDKTVRTYRTALNAFRGMLARQGIDASQVTPQVLDVQNVDAFIAFLDDKSPATEKLYLTAVRSFYAYLEDEGLGRPNLGKIQRRINQRTRKSAWSPEVFPREGIEKLIVYAESLGDRSTDEEVTRFKDEATIRAARRQARLRNLRDRALILVLADTGLRVAEACSLTYGQVDALEARFRSVRRKGYKRKGEKSGSTVLVSERALAAIREYQVERKNEARPAGMKTRTVPLFMRHDPGASDALKRLSEKSAWKIVKERAKKVLGPEAAEQIHPHSFRHYFVTVVLLETDLETARRLAGHASTDTTAKYAEIDPEVEERYHKIFNR